MSLKKGSKYSNYLLKRLGKFTTVHEKGLIFCHKFYDCIRFLLSFYYLFLSNNVWGLDPFSGEDNESWRRQRKMMRQILPLNTRIPLYSFLRFSSVRSKCCFPPVLLRSTVLFSLCIRGKWKDTESYMGAWYYPYNIMERTT